MQGVDLPKYLERIQHRDSVVIDDATLTALHVCHVHHVPFENLDVQHKRLFDLNIESIYRKIVDNNRGGFCYELNLLFNELLYTLGFQSRIIEARIFTERGEPGPPFDHMALHIKAGKEYLADVGFGDLFLKPLELREGIQTDGRNDFKMEQIDETRYLLSMAKHRHKFEKKYIFDLAAAKVSDFIQPCIEKQISPDSYFVKNLVCTRPTATGRITIFNNMLFERDGERRQETVITSDNHLRDILAERFNIVMKDLAGRE